MLQSSRLRFVGIAPMVALLAPLAGCESLNLNLPFFGQRLTQSEPGTTTTIVIVRHAERDPGTDPPLNTEGQARAQTLADVLGEQGITAIYCPDITRNRQTAEPIAQLLGLTPKYYTPALYVDTPTFADVVANDILANEAGGTVLFIGNVGSTALGTTGVLDELYMRLGGTGVIPKRYQDMYICTVPDDGPTRFIKTIYGPKSTLDP